MCTCRDPLFRPRQLALARGGDCLSDTRFNKTTPLRWRCALGHQWEATYTSAVRTWCPSCHRERKRQERLDELIEIAQSRGGMCLSTEYINNRSQMRWQCACGHEWDAPSRAIVKGLWCKVCRESSKDNHSNAVISLGTRHRDKLPSPEKLAQYKAELHRLMMQFDVDETSPVATLIR